MNITNGVIGTEKINCHQALMIGNDLLDSIVDKNFATVKYERKKKFVFLKAVNSAVTINNQIIAVDSTTLISRACLLVNRKEDMRDFLRFELSPYSLSLFDENGMCKTDKSAFYTNFSPIKNYIPHLNTV